MSDAKSRSRALGGLLAVLVVVTLAACTSGGSSGGAAKTEPASISPSAAPLTLTYAHEDEFNSYNNNTQGSASVANAVVVNQVLPGFTYAGPNGETEANSEYGSYEQVTSNPLTVKYTFNPKATWSDGVPVSCDDAVLAWAANSGRWSTGKRDPITGAKLTAFSAVRPGAWSNVESPQCGAGGRSFTVKYATVYADWDTLFGPGTILPAHIVEKESGVKSVIAAVKSNNTKTMIKLGDAYNSLWVFRPGQYKTAISPSAGPYQVTNWQAGQSITLTVNPHWWGTPPRASTLVIKFIPEGQQAQALRAGKVQVIDPSPTTDLLAQLKQPGTPVTVSTHDSFTWEHLDFNFDSAFKSKDLRQAFADCVPRQQIVDNLIKPQNPQAQILQSRFLLPFQPGYSQLADLGGQNYDSVNIAAAKKILQAHHKSGMTVKIAYQTPNPRRKAEVDLIRDFCGQAGFHVVDAGSNLFFGGALDRGDFDVALFAWTSSPLVTQSYATYMSNGVQNKGHYRNPKVDQLLRQLYSELTPTGQLQLEGQLDTILWSDLATVPLFSYPALVATTPGLRDVEYNPNESDITYNAQFWTR